MKTVTSREFNRDVSAAKRAADLGPVTITDHGKPSHVLLTIELFEQLTAAQELCGDRLWREQDSSIDLPITDRRREQPRELAL